MKYFPEIIYSTKIETKGCKLLQSEILSDKNLLDKTKFKTSEVIIPQTIANVVNGRWFINDAIVTKKEALNTIYNYKRKKVVGKISVESSSGRGVKFFDFESMSFEEFKLEIEKWNQRNVVFQECIEQHELFDKLNPSSVNTIRVITYIVNDKICCAPVVMRIGRFGSKVDNAHAGGMFIGIDNDGLLEKEAYTEYGEKYDKHPDTGIVFEGYKIPFIANIIKNAKKLHLSYQEMQFVSWDFTVDINENINLIEVNLVSQTIWMSQIANGKSFFEDNTEYMMKIANSKAGEL